MCVSLWGVCQKYILFTHNLVKNSCSSIHNLPGSIKHIYLVHKFKNIHDFVKNSIASIELCLPLGEDILILCSSWNLLWMNEIASIPDSIIWTICHRSLYFCTQLGLGEYLPVFGDGWPCHCFKVTVLQNVCFLDFSCGVLAGNLYYRSNTSSSHLHPRIARQMEVSVAELGANRFLEKQFSQYYVLLRWLPR